jgi:gliding motility-associated-like protein
MKLRFLSILFIAFICGNNPTYAQHAAVNPQIRFIENKNQWESTILYRADLPGGKLYAEKNKLTYVFYDTQLLDEMHAKGHEKESNTARQIEQEPQEPMMRLHAFSIDFVGAAASSTIVPVSKNPEKNNFYIGSDPSSWASNVSSYGQLNYQKVYTNTDLSIYESSNSMKYEFIVNPGGDPANIKLQYKGVDNIYLKDGELHIKTSVNEIVEQAPYIYQTINGKEVTVAGKFELTDSVVTFKITGKYSKKYTLVIDPKLIFSTYSGSVADNWGNTGTFDEAGNMYSGGTVFGVGFPTTLGAFQQSFAGGNQYYGFGIDVGILKYNPMGTGLIYATYLGGYRTEVPHSLVVNNNNELVVFGTTGSANFPTTLGAYDNTFNGGFYAAPFGAQDGVYFENGSDLFISKLKSDGSTLIASTYVGGSNNDGILYQSESLTINYGDQFRGDVNIDDNNNVYVSSNTHSSDFPITTGALQASMGGGFTDGCVFKIDNNLTALAWSTYLGGVNDDVSYSIQIDSMYNVFVAGGTKSNNFPTTTGALHQTALGGIDGFVTHIKSDGTAIISSTYVGTAAYDLAYFVQLDSLENVYLLGQTDQGNYPVTSGAYTNPKGGQFIHKLSRDLTTSIMSTVIGTGSSHPDISLTAFLVNDCGNIFLSGWGGEVNQGYINGSTHGLPVTSDAFQSTTDGSDFYIMVLGQNASSLLYSTFFGGNGIEEHVDGGTSRFDKKGIIYEAVCAGCGGSNAFPTTPGAWSNTNNSYFFYDDGTYYGFVSNCNNAAFKFDLTNLKADFSVTQTANCSNTIITVTNKSIGGKTFFWDFGDSTTSNKPGPLQHTYGKPGNYTITLIATDLTTCIGKDTMKGDVVVPKPPVLSVNTSDTTICKGDSVHLSITNNPTYQYLWSPSQGLSSTVIANPLASPNATTNYLLTVTDTNNCVVKKTVNVEVLDLDKTIGFSNESDCEGKLTTKLSNKSFGAKALYNWAFGDGNASQTQEGSIVHEYKEPGTYTVYLTISSNGCSFKDTVKITLEKIFLPNLVTPNGDGLNDVYEIKGNSDNWMFEVYNRWGDLLYKNSNYHNEWAGEGLSDGTYYYLVISPDGKRCKGWVQLLH